MFFHSRRLFFSPYPNPSHFYPFKLNDNRRLLYDFTDPNGEEEPSKSSLF